MGRRCVDVTPFEVALYMVRSKKSIRETAKHFKISKSVVHKLVKEYDGKYKEEIEEILNQNKLESRFKEKHDL